MGEGWYSIKWCVISVRVVFWEISERKNREPIDFFDSIRYNK